MPTATGAGRLFPPLDRRLKIPTRGASGLLVRKICEANKAGSFPKASEVLLDLAGLRISAKRVQWTTERVGQLLVEERDAQTEDFMERRSVRAAASGQEPVQLLVVSADGGRVQTRQEDPDQKWKEDKIGVVYDALACPEQAGEQYKGPEPLRRSQSWGLLRAGSGWQST
jgi:hypothetical protein